MLQRVMSITYEFTIKHPQTELTNKHQFSVSWTNSTAHSSSSRAIVAPYISNSKSSSSITPTQSNSDAPASTGSIASYMRPKPSGENRSPKATSPASVASVRGNSPSPPLARLSRCRFVGDSVWGRRTSSVHHLRQQASIFHFVKASWCRMEDEQLWCWK